MKNVLVLGGTGFVGARLCELLLRHGVQVTVTTRSQTHARHLPGSPLLTVLALDVHDAAALEQAVAGHESVVNLVAILHGNQAAFDRVHITLPQKLAQACMAAAVKRLVHVSAIGANALQPESAPSMYLRSKGKARRR